jgi:2-(1,2-epoxy-1,2-dihydrophenyl)acetyl-CoA isomerase
VGGNPLFECIQYEVLNGVAVITLNRPQVMNAINQTLGEELYQALKLVEQSEAVRAIVLTGAGRAFCSGQDLSDDTVIGESVNLSDRVRERYNLIITKMNSIPKPIIAAINGIAAGAGFGFALACDLRFATTEAKCTMAFNKIGLVPDSGSSYFLPRLVGVATALEWTWTAQMLTAQTLLAHGAVNQVIEADQLMSYTMAFAEKLAQGPTCAFGLTKQAMYTNFTGTLSDALELEATLQGVAGQSPDFYEGVQSFREKRPPQYTGKKKSQ